MLDKLKQVIREPLFHFLLIGVAIYAFYGIYAGESASDNERVVTVTAGEIQSLASQWRRVWSRAPTEEELVGIVRDHVRIQILYREAIAMGLDKGDTVIERRMAQKLELLAQGLMTPKDPSDAVLNEWYIANSDRYQQPDRYTITHVFFDPDKRHENAFGDAKAVLEELNSMSGRPADYSAYGDRLLLQSVYSNRSESELGSLFGNGFAENVVGLEIGIWHGPVLSGYGTHLVMINNVTLAPQPEYEKIRERLKRDWMSEQATELSERFIDGLKSRYEVVVEDAEVPMTIPRSVTVR